VDSRFDALGFLIFLAFLVISIFGKISARKAQQQRDERQRRVPGAPQWPGPVAGPGLPGYPKPSWPQPQRPQPPVPQRQPAWPSRAEATRPSADDDGEGVSMEGAPDAPSVPDELGRFDRETQRLDRPDLGQYRSQFSQYQPNMQRLKTALHHTEPAEAPRAQVAALADGWMESALADRNSVARAVVLAEVLGKPKAYRGRGRR
jgi:hypothetical protein